MADIEIRTLESDDGGHLRGEGANDGKHCTTCDLETVRERPDLEACAELIVKLDENGPAKGNRERVKLLADWQRVRKPR